MAMNFPLFKFEYFNDNISLVLAVVIGIGFGFFLERGGFGNARMLAAQFYFRDMRVFKVMFTAIVTAMLGVFYFAWIGWLDLSLVYLTPTYLVPQIAGGLILGIGFVIGGYCPGTAVVSMSTGRIDGLVYVAGLFLGVFVFGEMFPILESFYYSTSMGQLTLPEITNLPYGMLVFAVVLMAIGGFIGAEKTEKYFAKKDSGTAV
jgi:uncharacterized protein